MPSPEIPDHDPELVGRILSRMPRLLKLLARAPVVDASRREDDSEPPAPRPPRETRVELELRAA